MAAKADGNDAAFKIECPTHSLCGQTVWLLLTNEGGRSGKFELEVTGATTTENTTTTSTVSNDAVTPSAVTGAISPNVCTNTTGGTCDVISEQKAGRGGTRCQQLPANVRPPRGVLVRAQLAVLRRTRALPSYLEPKRLPTKEHQQQRTTTAADTHVQIFFHSSTVCIPASCGANAPGSLLPPIP
jgi:hypothetical protein